MGTLAVVAGVLLLLLVFVLILKMVDPRDWGEREIEEVKRKGEEEGRL
jgi:hypothetical protein